MALENPLILNYGAAEMLRDQFPMTTQNAQYYGKDLEVLSSAVNYNHWIFSVFKNYLGSSVAEIGAGMGSFSKLILTKNVKKLKAYEPSENLISSLREACGKDNRVEIINDYFSTGSNSERFDSIVYINVLEHVEDDVSEIKTAAQRLNPKGHLLVFVPALKWLYSDMDRTLGHYRRYIEADLVRLIKQSGLSITKARYFDLAGVIPWYINFVWLKKTFNRKGVRLYDKWIVPFMRVIETAWPPPLGKNIIIVAKK